MSSKHTPERILQEGPGSAFRVLERHSVTGQFLVIGERMTEEDAREFAAAPAMRDALEAIRTDPLLSIQRARLIAKQALAQFDGEVN